MKVEKRWRIPLLLLPGGHGRQHNYDIVTSEVITSASIVVGEGLQRSSSRAYHRSIKS